LKPIIEGIVAANPKAVLEYKAGKQNALQFLIGQCMKATKGSANPGMLAKILEEILMYQGRPDT
jgi:aspartyl-tRNA(Asn)/glutamyl-tRNA(Gln) amidotransferase subunit B